MLLQMTVDRGSAFDPGGGESPFAAAIAERDAAVIDMVREAVAKGRVLLAFQPVWTADGDEISFHEGLIRIHDDAGRVIPAKDFIESIEEDLLGRHVDCLSLQMGLAELARYPDLRLSINMSARSIGYRPWSRILESGLGERPDIAERLILEITESSAIVMPELVRSFMEDLQDRGVAFALDDFGAGYTSFRYLRDFYFDILKIDGQFIRGLAGSPDNQALTEALVSLGEHFEMYTVAESVETAEDAEAVRALGVDCLQGFHLGRPETEPAWRGADRASA